MDANAKIVAEQSVYRWVSLCEQEIKRWSDCSSFELHHCRLDWSQSRTAHRGGWYTSGPGINLAMWLLFRDRGDYYRMYEYASFDGDAIIGGFYANDSNLAQGMIVCHEMAHAVQFYRKKALNMSVDKAHGKSFKQPYAQLRKAVFNPKLPNQVEMKKLYNEYVSSVLR